MKRLGVLLYSALGRESTNHKTHTCTLTRHYTAQGTWPSMWNHYAGFLPPAECRWDTGPTYYSPDVPVIHHCLPCPQRTLEDVWSTAPECVLVCVCVCVLVCSSVYLFLSPLLCTYNACAYVCVVSLFFSLSLCYSSNFCLQASGSYNIN